MCAYQSSFGSGSSVVLSPLNNSCRPRQLSHKSSQRLFDENPSSGLLHPPSITILHFPSSGNQCHVRRQIGKHLPGMCFSSHRLGAAFGKGLKYGRMKRKNRVNCTDLLEAEIYNTELKCFQCNEYVRPRTAFLCTLCPRQLCTCLLAVLFFSLPFVVSGSMRISDQ